MQSQRWFLAVLVALAAASGTHAQSGESLTSWEWSQEIRVPEADAAAKYSSFAVPPSVFDQAAEDLRDLRIVDAKDRFIAYALFVRNPVNRQDPVAFQQFAEGSTDAVAAVRLELKGEAKLEHNAMEITTAGDNFRRRVEIEGKDSDAGKWSTILSGEKDFVASFDVDGKEIRINTIRYPSSRLAILRMRVFADPSKEEKTPPKIEQLRVFRQVTVAGEYVTHKAKLGERAPTRDDLGPASAWLIDFGNRAPCSQLLLNIAESGFARPYRVERVVNDQFHEVLARGELRRNPGEEATPLQIDMTEVLVRELRLVVADAANPPLTLRGVDWVAAKREVIFAAGDAAAPLRLYYGNPAALPPRYDFAANLPEHPEPQPITVGLGERAKNPLYQPPEKLWSERWPGLIYVVLTFSSIALLVVLLMLARMKLPGDAAPPASGPTETN